MNNKIRIQIGLLRQKSRKQMFPGYDFEVINDYLFVNVLRA